jgi:hypothetical protein
MSRPKGSKNKIIRPKIKPKHKPKTIICDYKEKSKDEIFTNQLLYQFKQCSIINYSLMNVGNLENKITRLILEYKNSP